MNSCLINPLVGLCTTKHPTFFTCRRITAYKTITYHINLIYIPFVINHLTNMVIFSFICKLFCLLNTSIICFF